MKVAILTKSDKNGGFCVAGIDMGSKRLVRIVSSDSTTHHTIPKWCMKNVDVLDVIDVSVSKCVPSFCQQENVEVWLRKWGKIGDISANYLLEIADNSSPFIFGNECFFLEENDAQKLSYSLMIVKVTDLSISHNDYNKTKARFTYNGKSYTNMSITDSDYYKFDGSINNAVLVISIPDEGQNSLHYEGKRCYKFVSKIFEI